MRQKYTFAYNVGMSSTDIIGTAILIFVIGAGFGYYIARLLFGL